VFASVVLVGIPAMVARIVAEVEEIVDGLKSFEKSLPIPDSDLTRGTVFSHNGAVCLIGWHFCI
jgi:hypothetical protein